MKRVKGKFKIRRVYQGLTVGKLPTPKLAKSGSGEKRERG